MFALSAAKSASIIRECAAVMFSRTFERFDVVDENLLRVAPRVALVLEITLSAESILFIASFAASAVCTLIPLIVLASFAIVALAKPISAFCGPDPPNVMLSDADNAMVPP